MKIQTAVATLLSLVMVGCNSSNESIDNNVSVEIDEHVALAQELIAANNEVLAAIEANPSEANISYGNKVKKVNVGLKRDCAVKTSPACVESIAQAIHLIDSSRLR